jgi:hypothetical protein
MQISQDYMHYLDLSWRLILSNVPPLVIVDIKIELNILILFTLPDYSDLEWLSL